MGLTAISVRTGPTNDPAAARAAGALVLGLVSAAAIDLLLGDRSRTAASSPPKPIYRSGPSRTLHAAAGLLSLSVLADSAVEHYRGSYKNPGMAAPLIASGLGVAASAGGAFGLGSPRRRAGLYGLAGAVGLAGLGFHLVNLFRRPGGLNAVNLFYAAPVGAPAALTLSGALGLSAVAIERTLPDQKPRILGLPAGRVVSALTSLGLFGAIGEAGLFHYRGAFQNPAMLIPVCLPPAAAVLTAKAAVLPGPVNPKTRFWLWLTALIGLGGAAFHAYGISRAMGGWRNWSQNLVDGPPIPAPPSFSALALAGLAALALRDRAEIEVRA